MEDIAVSRKAQAGRTAEEKPSCRADGMEETSDLDLELDTVEGRLADVDWFVETALVQHLPSQAQFPPPPSWH